MDTFLEKEFETAKTAQQLFDIFSRSNGDLLERVRKKLKARLMMNLAMATNIKECLEVFFLAPAGWDLDQESLEKAVELSQDSNNQADLDNLLKILEVTERKSLAEKVRERKQILQGDFN